MKEHKPLILLGINIILVILCISWLMTRLNYQSKTNIISNNQDVSHLRNQLPSQHYPKKRSSSSSSQHALQRFLGYENFESDYNKLSQRTSNIILKSSSSSSSSSSTTVSNSGISRPKHIFGSKPSYSTLKIFGVGLSFSGSNKLARFFTHLGLHVLPYDIQATAYLPHAGNYSWEGIYDDVDVVLDLPVALYYKELMEVYPQALFIATSRDVHLWFDLISEYMKTHESLFAPADYPLSIRMLHKLAFGSDHVNKDTWISSYQKHYQTVREVIPTNKLLKIHFEGLNPKLPTSDICRFIQLSDHDCSSVTSIVSDGDPRKGEPRKGISSDSGSGSTTSSNNNKGYTYMMESESTSIQIQQVHETLETIGFQSRQSVYDMLTISVRSSKPAKQKYAYVSYIDLPVSNKVTFDVSALVKPLLWCQSIRHTSTINNDNNNSNSDTSDSGALVTTYDIVGLLPSTPNATVRHKLHSCFDRLIVNISALALTPSDLYNNIVEGRHSKIISEKMNNDNHDGNDDEESTKDDNNDDAVDVDVSRHTVWVFALTEYKRIQYFDTTNGALILKNMDAFFFGDDFLSEANPTTSKSSDSSSASGGSRVYKSFYAPYSALSPISTHYFNIQPSIQILVDLMEFYLIDRWETQTGWMGYGSFSFSPRDPSLLLTGVVVDEAPTTDDEVDIADEGGDGVIESVASGEDLGDRFRILSGGSDSGNSDGDEGGDGVIESVASGEDLGDRFRILSGGSDSGNSDGDEGNDTSTHSPDNLESDTINAPSTDSNISLSSQQRGLLVSSSYILRNRHSQHTTHGHTTSTTTKKHHSTSTDEIKREEILESHDLYSIRQREAFSRLAARKWESADWTFDGAWSDTGMFFYYFYLLTGNVNLGGTLNAKTVEKYLLDSSALRSSRGSETAVAQLLQDCLSDVASSLGVETASLHPFPSHDKSNSTNGNSDSSSDSGGDEVITSVLRMGCILCVSCSGACCVATHADCAATTCCTTSTETGVSYFPDVDLPYIPPIYYPPYIPPIYYPPYIPPVAKDGSD